MSGQAIAYYRVSTDRQAERGMGLPAQQEAVRRFVAAERMSLLGEFTEAESAYRAGRLTLHSRPRLEEALKLCHKSKGTLVIAALDRLARNVVFIATLIESRVKFIALDVPHATPFMLHIYAAVAEDESRQRGELLRASIAIARSRGVQWARAAYDKSERTRQRSESLRPIIEEIRASGIRGTTNTANELNRRRIPFRQGRQWSTDSAKTLLKHLGLYGQPLEPWSVVRRRIVRFRQKLVVKIAQRTYQPGTRWTESAADVLNRRHIKTAHGLEWDAKRVENVLRYARAAGLWD